MSRFEEHLIEKIHPEVSPLWAVADSDGLFRSDAVARLLGKRGVEVVVYEDPMAFRFLYEHKVRPRLESTDPGCHVIVVDPGNDGLRCLAADVYEASQRIEVALGDLFPTLSRGVLRELEPAVLSELWQKRDQFPAGAQGDRETADLVLRVAYKIEPSFINSLQDVVQILVGIHFANKRLPGVLAQRLEQVAKSATGQMTGLHDLIHNPGLFWQFMQERWEEWVNPPDGSKVKETAHAPVTFDDPRLRVWMDSLFLEGILKPVENAPEALPQPWCAVGVIRAKPVSTDGGLSSMRERLVKAIPESDAGYPEWLQFARRYSAHVADVFSRDQGLDDTEAFWNELWKPVNERFAEFVDSRLESLANLPPTRPVLVNHIARFLARRAGPGANVALLVLDGLSVAQWHLIRRELDRLIPGLCASEDACFTLVPSVTNIARQSLYAGELPVFFEGTVERTDADGKRWKNFWDGAFGKPVRSVHLNVEGRDADLPKVREAVDAGARAIGVTIRMPDEIIHGATLGWRGVAEQVRLWARQPFLSECVQTILDAGYDLFLTSDHGNLEAVGEGGIPQGVLVERSGQRVRVYRDATIFAHSAMQYGDRARPGINKLLPPDYWPLIHAGRGAFATGGQSIVMHGGTSFDEMVVPFVELSVANDP